MDRWLGRVALVTGASSGIGATTAKALVEAGMKVVGAARRVDRIKELGEKLKEAKGSLLAVKCDLTKDEDIYELFKTIQETYGGIDICINNAGRSFDKSLLEGSPVEWREMINLNVIALCLCTKLAVASMKERGIDDGHIINIGSTAGHNVGPPSRAHFYSGTKFAVRAITEGVRQELREAKSHIRVSLISPSLVYTELPYVVLQGRPEKADTLYSTVPSLQADDVTSAILHVISSPPHVEINDIILRSTKIAVKK